MSKSIDSIGHKPEKKQANPLVKHQAGEVFRPRGAALKAGEQAKPKGYVEPKTQEPAGHVLSVEEHAASKQHAAASRKQTIRKWAVVAVILGILVLASIPVVNYVQRRIADDNRRKLVNTACTTGNQALVNDAIAAINSGDPSTLKDVAEAIERLQNSELDQNCLAIIAWSKIQAGDPAGAKAKVDQIRPIYRPENNLGDSASVYSSDPENLSIYVTFSQNAATDINKTGDVYMSTTNKGDRTQ